MPETVLEHQIAEQARDIAELRRQLNQEIDRLQQLIHVLTRLNSSQSLTDLLELIMSAGMDLVHAESGSLMLVDEETNELTFEVATGTPGRTIAKYRIPPGQGIAGWVVDHAKPVAIDNPGADPRFYDRMDKVGGFTTRSILAVPLIVQDRVIGVVEMVNKVGAPGFDHGDLELALAFATQASIAIDNARIRARLAGHIDAHRLLYRL